MKTTSTIAVSVPALSTVISMTAEQAQTVVITAAVFVACAAIDGAKENAKVVIVRTLANDCDILLSILNSATKDELKALLPLVKRYVQDTSASTASPTHTIEYNKTLAAYVYEVRDPAVLERQKIDAEIEGMQVIFDTIKPFNANLHAYVSKLKTSAVADAKRKLASVKTVCDIAEILRKNEPLFTQTGIISAVLADVAALAEFKPHNLSALQLVVGAHAENANNLVNSLKQARTNYKAALSSITAPMNKQLGFADLKQALEALPANNITELEHVTRLAKQLSAVMGSMIAHNIDTKGKRVMPEDGATVDNIEPAIQLLVLEMAKFQAKYDADKAAKAELLAQETAHTEELEEIKEEHAAELEELKRNAEIEAQQKAALAEFEELAENCNNFGLDNHLKAYMALGNGDASKPYLRQLQTAIHYISDLDDATEQDRIADLYNSFPTALSDFKDAYGSMVIAEHKAKQALANKAKNLLTAETTVNNDNHMLASQVLKGLDVAVDGLIAKHPKLEVSLQGVLIALYQQLGKKIEGFSQVREAGSKKNAA